jgi:hypothetical protein
MSAPPVRRITAMLSGQKVTFQFQAGGLDVVSAEKALAKYLVAAWLERSKRAPVCVTRYDRDSPPRCVNTTTGLTKTTYEGGHHG